MSVKEKRQQKIAELVGGHAVMTQEDLARLLTESGFKVTQATVSRDIREMRLTKSMTPEGQYRYSLTDRGEDAMQERFIRIFAHSVLSVTGAGNLVVIKTIAGSASAAAEAVDSLHWPELMGTIAGDNTIFVAVRDEAAAKETVQKLQQLRQLQ